MILVLALLLVPCTGCIQPDDDRTTHITYQFETPVIDSISIGNITVWDVELKVRKYTPRDASNTPVDWNDIQVRVSNTTGYRIIPMTEVLKDTGNYGDGPQVWYVENAESTRTMDVGDSIKITHMSEDFKGSTVAVHNKDTEIGRMSSTTLPLDFPP